MTPPRTHSRWICSRKEAHWGGIIAKSQQQPLSHPLPITHPKGLSCSAQASTARGTPLTLDGRGPAPAWPCCRALCCCREAHRGACIPATGLRSDPHSIPATFTPAPLCSQSCSLCFSVGVTKFTCCTPEPTQTAALSPGETEGEELGTGLEVLLLTCGREVRGCHSPGTPGCAQFSRGASLPSRSVSPLPAQRSAFLSRSGAGSCSRHFPAAQNRAAGLQGAEQTPCCERTRCASPGCGAPSAPAGGPRSGEGPGALTAALSAALTRRDCCQGSQSSTDPPRPCPALPGPQRLREPGSKERARRMLREIHAWRTDRRLCGSPQCLGTELCLRQPYRSQETGGGRKLEGQGRRRWEVSPGCALPVAVQVPAGGTQNAPPFCCSPSISSPARWLWGQQPSQGTPKERFPLDSF